MDYRAVFTKPKKGFCDYTQNAKKPIDKYYKKRGIICLEKCEGKNKF